MFSSMCLYSKNSDSNAHLYFDLTHRDPPTLEVRVFREPKDPLRRMREIWAVIFGQKNIKYVLLNIKLYQIQGGWGRSQNICGSKALEYRQNWNQQTISIVVKYMHGFHRIWSHHTREVFVGHKHWNIKLESIQQ